MCVLTVDPLTGLLRAANLGDSGYMVARGGKVLFRSPEQEHVIGRPFQLSSVGGETPAEAQLSSISLAKGDVIVVASDGLFDNLYDHEIAQAVWDMRYMRADQLVRVLCDQAYRVSVDPRVDSPWAENAREELHLAYSGGKMDDISLALAKVVYV